MKAVKGEGIPAEEILRTADAHGVDLIILGYSDRKGLSRLIAGSVHREVRERAKVPVLLAKRAAICEEPYSWSDALAAVSVTAAVVLGLFLVGTVLK